MASFQCRNGVAWIAFAALCSAHTAEADPITLNFRADITGFCAVECQPVEFSVPFTVRFDAAVTSDVDLGYQAYKSYGSPSVTIPLPGQGQAGAIPYQYGTWTIETRFMGPNGVWSHAAELVASEVFEGRFDENDDELLAWQLSMYKEVFGSQPTLSARDYVTLLGKGPIRFSYGFNTLSARGAYIGTATLLTEIQPVPEPTSLLLLASGLGAIGMRAWRRRLTSFNGTSSDRGSAKTSA